MGYVNKIIGNDLQLDSNGDLSISNTGDIQLLSSSKNMLQSAHNTVLTPKGSDLYNLSFGSGLHSYLGQPNVTNTRLLAANTVKNTLLRNARIKAIPEIITKQGKDTEFTIECKLVSIEDDNVYNFVVPMKL